MGNNHGELKVSNPLPSIKNTGTHTSENNSSGPNSPFHRRPSPRPEKPHKRKIEESFLS